MSSNSSDRPANSIKSVCVFCSSSSKLEERYYRLGAQVGRIIASKNIHLVYGGAAGGIMGKLADAALEEGGEVTGVIPEVLSGHERRHQNLTALHVTKDMHERQKKMSDLSDAFLILPGGLGTLAEFFEILTWKQIGLHEKPIGLLNNHGFWKDLLEQFVYCRDEHFMYSDPASLFDTMEEVEEINGFLEHR